MPITIDKVLSAQADPYTADKMVVRAVLSDGRQKRIVTLSNVPNDDSLARGALLIRGEELFSGGAPYREAVSVIESRRKVFEDSIPSRKNAEADIGGIANLEDAKAMILKLTMAIHALKDSLG